MADINIKPFKSQREFDGEKYLLTKIDYSEEDITEDAAYHQKKGRKTKTMQEDGFWLLYTKIG